jgi:hypothetical protein
LRAVTFANILPLASRPPAVLLRCCSQRPALFLRRIISGDRRVSVAYLRVPRLVFRRLSKRPLAQYPPECAEIYANGCA